ncbi:MAG: DUF234 domain-containing protein [Campylobacterota bacterium]|nr:DUF234 domain-containing protein [Campylobacterota bacterium]
MFGGLDISIDMTQSLETLIEKLILKKYRVLRNEVSVLTQGDPEFSTILTALASGDRRTNSAFKRANVSFDNGIDIVDELCDMKVLKLEKSQQSLSNLDDQYTVSEKLLFTTPFMRFWFAFISPIFKGVRDGNFEEFNKLYSNKKAEFTNLIFEQLCHEFIRLNLEGDPIRKIGRYWDDDIDIDLLVKTKSGKTIAGVCKYTNSKVKKSELNILKQKCEDVKIDVDQYVIFSKKGFTTELKGLKGDELRLYTVKSLKQLVL